MGAFLFLVYPVCMSGEMLLTFHKFVKINPPYF